MRRFLSLFTMLMLCGVLAFAQGRVVSGRVTDEKGAPISFATISENGIKNVTSADGDGNFSLKIKGTGSVTFTVTAAGYKPATATPVGNSAVIVMERSGEALQEVVITALGIKRQRKDLGYSTARVTNEELTQSSPVNVANGLQGKVSGLNVTSVNNGVFDDVKINLRGIRSLTGNNNPMFLLDGVQTDLNFLSSINPQDIADVTILKGASGAGIYGPDARNGVIVVTTKRGGSSNNAVVTVSRTSQFSSISFFPKFQTEFGSGGSGSYIPYENWSWGPAFDGSMVELGSPLTNGQQQMVPYSPNNSRKEFFNTGVTNQTDVSFGVKDFYLSVQDAKITGIVPDDRNRRTGIRMNSSKTYGKFKASFGVNYIQQNYNVFDDAAMGAYNAANNVGLNDGLLNLIFNTPAQVPITSYKNFKDNPFAKYDTYFNHYGLNPYIALDNWRNTGVTDDIITNLDLNFKASSTLSFTWRLAGTVRNAESESTSKGQTTSAATNSNTNTPIPGAVSQSATRRSRLSSEFFANWNKTVKDFKFNVIAGHYVRESEQKNSNVGASNLVVPELFNISNGVGGVTGGNGVTKTRLMSVYGSIDIGYKNWFNVQVTGRNDWASVFSEDNNSFFYPGVNASLVLTDAIPGLKRDNFLSFLKVKGSWNKTANADINPYQTASTFSGTSAGFPYNVPGFTANNAALNPSLKPEFIDSKEVGLEIGFLKDRIIFEASAYTQNNTDQIISVQLSNATGYTSAVVNAAAFVNKGLEFDLKLTPLINLGKVRFDVKTNASYNTSEVKSIYSGLDRLAIGGFATASNYALVGKPAFVFLAADYLRDDQGRVIVSKTTGLPSVDPNLKQFGRTSPLWIVGLTPSISYKGLTFSVVGEYRGGHYAYASIGSAMAWTGVSLATAQNHRERFVFPNSVYNDGTKLVENTSVTIDDANNFYTGLYRQAQSNFLIKADSWRIRELSLGYDFPATVFAGQKIIKALNITLNARNLQLWLPKSNQFTDPDFNFTTGNTTGVSTSQINPPTRLIGFNVTATF
jgi:TonB-linked SusC/RagA family outer membrane protein